MPVDRKRFQMNVSMHSAFRREVQRLRAGVASVDLADPAAVAGLKRRYDFFEGTLHTHHRGEDDFLWPVAMVKATPEEKAVIQSMEAEHEALAAALAVTAADFGGLGPDSDREAIQGHLQDLEDILAGHTAHEERDATPILEKYLEDEDLKKLMAHARQSRDSGLVLPWVCDGAPQEVQSATWGMLPGFVRIFVRPMQGRKYRQFSQECGV